MALTWSKNGESLWHFFRVRVSRYLYSPKNTLKNIFSKLFKCRNPMTSGASWGRRGGRARPRRRGWWRSRRGWTGRQSESWKGVPVVVVVVRALVSKRTRRRRRMRTFFPFQVPRRRERVPGGRVRGHQAGAGLPGGEKTRSNLVPNSVGKWRFFKLLFQEDFGELDESEAKGKREEVLNQVKNQCFFLFIST